MGCNKQIVNTLSFKTELLFPDRKRSLDFCLFRVDLCRRKVFLRFIIIYESYQCCTVIFIGKICWFITWIEKLLFFSSITQNSSASCNMSSLHWLIILLKVASFQCLMLHLILALYMLAFMRFSPTVRLFLFWIKVWLLNKLLLEPFHWMTFLKYFFIF